MLKKLKNQQTLLHPIVLMLAAVVLLISLVSAAGFGYFAIAPWDIVAIVLNHTGIFHFHRTWPDYFDGIVMNLRLPRVIEGALVGAALAVAGALFQGLLRNPLAEPYLLGISSGAALGATTAFLALGPALAIFGPVGVTVVANYGLPGLAFVGSLLAVACVYGLARVGERTPVVTMILAGVAVSALLGAVQTLLILRNAAVTQHLVSLYSWLAGGIIPGEWPQIGLVGVLVLCGLLVAWWCAPLLDAFALGEEGALHLGVRVERAKLLIVTVAALLVAAAVSLSGLVSFVGLFIPHVCRLVVGPRHRMLLPVVALVGSVFVVWADVLARILVKSGELPLGVITALVGGPFFLWLLRRSGSDYRY